MQNVDWRPPYTPKARVRAHYPSKCGLAPHPPYTPRARVRAHGAQGPWAAGGRRQNINSFWNYVCPVKVLPKIRQCLLSQSSKTARLAGY